MVASFHAEYSLFCPSGSAIIIFPDPACSMGRNPKQTAKGMLTVDQCCIANFSKGVVQDAHNLFVPALWCVTVFNFWRKYPACLGEKNLDCKRLPPL